MANDLSRYVVAGLPEKVATVASLQDVISRGERLLKGYEEAGVREQLGSAMEISGVRYCEQIGSQVESSQRSLEEAQRNYSEFAAERDKSTKLAQQLRDIANELLQGSSQANSCPLCHSEFPPGELIEHIQSGVDRELEAKAAPLLKEIRERKQKLATVRFAGRVAEWLRGFCERSEFSASEKISSILEEIAISHKSVTDATVVLERTREELSHLSDDGITAEGYEAILPQVRNALGQQDAPSAKAINDLCVELSSKREAASSKLKVLRAEIIATEEAIGKLLAGARSAGESHESIVSTTRERIATTASILERLQVFSERVAWPADSALSELRVALASVRTAAADFQATLAKERSNVKRLAAATKRKEEIDKQLAGLTPRIERLREAHDVLQKIQNEHSLNAAVEESLQQNRVAIETIFGRIHSPAEFKGLGDTITTLIRKSGGTPANLHQISTGQRAAFALSLFLAQNAQLRTAPPVILIDDPIAHIDDLNCLSFLDFLRDLVIDGNRQIVFATAHEKLAMLFERKFEFLGDNEFRRYELTR